MQVECLRLSRQFSQLLLLLLLLQQPLLHSQL